MVAWAIKNMGGIIPLADSRALPENMAEEAYNCDLSSGALDGLPLPELIHDFSANPNTVRRAYRFPDPAGLTGDAWLPLPSEFSSVARSPLANDASLGYRIYWTNPGELCPHWNTHANLLINSAYFDLGIVQPSETVAPGVSSSGGVSPETVFRSYCYTYVNAYGEESRPSKPSAVVSGLSDATWSITGLPTTAPANPAGRFYPAVTGLKLYRTVTGTTSGGQFFQVAEFVYGVSSPTDPYSDTSLDTTVVAADLPLLSTGWGNPPDNLDGLTALPGGMVVGFVGNTVYFCEPDRPHAWPAEYAQSLHYNIVGFGVWQQSLVVLTTGFPSTGQGLKPSSFVFTTVRVPEPCISRGSIITDLMGVYYASQNGLVMLNYFGMQNQTLSLVTKNTWLTEYRAASTVACRHRSQYLAINGSGEGFLIDYSEKRLGFMKLNTFKNATAIWNDEYSGDAYIISDKKVYRWDSPNTASMNFRWRSKLFYTQVPVSLGACQISIGPSIATAVDPGASVIDNGDTLLVLPSNVNAQFRLLVGDDDEAQAVIFTRNLTKPQEIFRLPSGFKDFAWQCEIVSRVPIHSIQLASTMRELRDV
jgi:hypothetical protein